ncbi:OB-fold-containig protein [Bosea sp. 2YAB26]|jgi:membrane protein implicated in regulation of membrane protease activity|uniref:OB-fold-containig protein n=1 Tax=Bosea sp. 2YAB26 TaxID=3237478 RepID=UPI003F9146DF
MSALTAPGLYPFTIAALILVGIVAIEILAMVVGMSISSLVNDGLSHHGVHSEHGPLDAWMSWLNRGGVPLLVLIMIWLASFAIAGFAIQGVAQALLSPLPTLFASLLAVMVALPMTRALSRWTARIIPGDESNAISQSDLIGLTGTVTLGPLDQGKPGRVRVRDLHGNIHVLRAKAAAGHLIPQGASVLVVDGSNGLFEAIPAPDELGAQT